MQLVVIFILGLLASAQKTGRSPTVKDCVSSPVEYGKPTVLLFNLPEKFEETRNSVHIRTGVGTVWSESPVMDYVWNRTTNKRDVYTEKDYVFGGIHDVSLFLIIKATTTAHAGVYGMETSDHAYTCNCSLQVDLPVKTVELKLNSQNGLLEVNESPPTDVIFQCTGDLDQSPTLTLVNDDGKEAARLNGIPGRRSELRHRMRNVRCENNAVYTCRAEQGGVKLYEYSATLKVLCVMRVEDGSFSSSNEAGLAVLDGRKGHGELSFNVLTTQRPHTYGFLHLGADIKGRGTPPKIGHLRVEFKQTDVVYKSMCRIIASRVTEVQDGYYNVTMATSSQSLTFTFYLQVQNISSSAMKMEQVSLFTEHHALRIGLGVGVSISFAVVMVMVMVMVILRRKRMSCSECFRKLHQNHAGQSRGISVEAEEYHAPSRSPGQSMERRDGDLQTDLGVELRTVLSAPTDSGMDSSLSSFVDEETPRLYLPGDDFPDPPDSSTTALQGEQSRGDDCGSSEKPEETDSFLDVHQRQETEGRESNPERRRRVDLPLEPDSIHAHSNQKC